MLYFDYAASTPVDSQVLEVMEPYFNQKYGNPGSLHKFGQDALKAIDSARETIVSSFGLSPNKDFRSVIFTGSATEANNLVLKGVLKKIEKEGNLKNPKIIISSIEHESIIDTCKLLESEGVDVAVIPVNEEGVINLKKIEEEVNSQTILVSVMYVNNELGTIQPIKEISKIIKEQRSENNSSYPFFHTDAVQAFQLIDCNVADLGVDFMTISAHKIYGPKGIGALYIKSFDYLSPIITGGGQEFGLRSGTQSVPLIAGFAKAVELTNSVRTKERERLKDLSSYFWEEVKEVSPKAKLNGPDLESSKRLPHIMNVSFPGGKSEEMLIKLDMAGVAVSTGAACSARSVRESHVLQALNLPYNIRSSSLRFSFGKPTTKEEITKLLKKLKETL